MGHGVCRRRKADDGVARSARSSCDRDHHQGKELSHAETARRRLMTGNGATNDRVGCLRNDDRCAAQGLLSPDSRAEEVMTTIARGCGNAAPMEITKRFSTGAWKSRTEREIPTFPQADSFLLQMRRT